MSNINYAQAVQQAKNGSQDAISDLYNATNKTAYGIAYQYLKNEDNALDVLQTAYVKAFENLDKLQAPEKFDKWLNRIVQNQSKDFMKKKTAILFSEMGEENDAPIEFEDDRTDERPDAAIDYQETKRLVQEILSSLSDEQRLVTLMFYFENLSVKEIAEQLECSENTVKSRLNYARQKIKVEVLELEKKGTKLYSLAPIPFFIFILQNSDFTLDLNPMAAKTLAQKIAADTSAASTTAAQAAAGTAAGTAKAAGSGLIIKIAAGIVAAGLVIGSIIAITKIAGRNSDTSSSLVSSASTQQAESSTPADVSSSALPDVSSSDISASAAGNDDLEDEFSPLNMELLGLLGKTNKDVRELLGDANSADMWGLDKIDLKYMDTPLTDLMGEGGAEFYNGSLLRIAVEDPSERILSDYYASPDFQGESYPHELIPDELRVLFIYCTSSNDDFYGIFTFEGTKNFEEINRHFGEPSEVINIDMATDYFAMANGIKAYYQYDEYYFEMIFYIQDNGELKLNELWIMTEPINDEIKSY